MASGLNNYYLVPYILFFLKFAYKIRNSYGFGEKRDKNSELWEQAKVRKEKLISNVNHIKSYAMPYDSANIISKNLPSISIIERIYVIGWEFKSNISCHFQTMRKDINLAFHNHIIVENVAVEIAELKSISFWSKTLKKCSNICFYNNSLFEGNQVLETLDK